MTTRSLFTSASGAKGSGTQTQSHVFKVDVLATDAINDVLAIAPLSGDLIPVRVTYYTAGVAGLTAAAVGFYKSEEVGGDVIDADAFDAAVDLSASGTDAGLTAVAAGDRYKTIRELVGTTAGNPSQFNLALTLSTEPTANGTVTIVVEFAQA